MGYHSFDPKEDPHIGQRVLFIDYDGEWGGH